MVFCFPGRTEDKVNFRELSNQKNPNQTTPRMDVVALLKLTWWLLHHGLIIAG